MKRAAALSLLITTIACGARCGGSEKLAELAARTGAEVERDEATQQGAWHEALLGTQFRVGDGLRTGAASSAELALVPSGSAHVSPHSIVRFMATPPSDPNRHVALEVGELEVSAGQIDLEIHTPRALAQVSRGSKIKLSMRDGRAVFDLTVGRVVLAHDGVKRVLEPDKPVALTEHAELAADAPHDAGAELESDAGLLLGDAAAETETAIAPTDAGKPAAATEVSALALRMQALESATLHVSSAPVDVFVPAGACTHSAELRVDGTVFSLSGAGANLELPLGAHVVRIACAESKREARLLVKRDPARLELPRRAQSVRVEADGRRYTVRYQNLLPDLTMAWPGETERGAFTLVVRSGERELTRELDRPEHELSGDAIGEGEHRFWFHDAAGRSSKPTTLRLAFDNTARSAYLSSPLEGAQAPDGALAVEGAALVGSAVSVEGGTTKLDEQGRFHAHPLLAPGQKAVSVRVEHPGSGVHYYLRRLR